jgi:hypothetical protein
MSEKTYCYWSVGDGQFGFLLQTMIDSARRAGVTTDFHVFSDRQIKGATTHLLTKPERKLIKHGEKFRFDFKLTYLKRMLQLDYDYFVYLDADSYFTRNPGNPLRWLNNDPAHMFFESNLAEPTALIRDNWWGIPHSVLIAAMRELGVTSKEIYHVNGGLFIIHRDQIARLISLMDSFWEHLLKKGYKLNVDEPLFAYAMHRMCDDPSKHLLAAHLDSYGMWYEKASNPNGQPFLHCFIMTGLELPANPAIVHCIMNKPAMMKMSMTSHERVMFESHRRVQKVMDAPARMLRKILKIKTDPLAWALKRVAPDLKQ